MLAKTFKLITILLILCVTACASLRSDYEQPEVTVSAFKLLPSNGLPKFEIQLHIINPNGSDLKLRGMSYSASIEGHKVLSGVANQIPVIVAYGEGDVTLTGGLDIFSGFRLFSDLVRKGNAGINYALNVKLDAGSLIPNIHIERRGEIIPPTN